MLVAGHKAAVGRELWVAAPAVASTPDSSSVRLVAGSSNLVADIRAGADSSAPVNVLALNASAPAFVFVATAGADWSASILYATDITAAGTCPLALIQSVTLPAFITRFG